MNTSQPDPPPQWSPEVRTWVSLLLFAHLFAVVVAVTAYTRPSSLQEQLHDLFDPYLRNLHLTAYPLSYPYARFHLTHGARNDVDYVCEVDVQKPDGTTETVTLPSSGLQPPIRSRRYQALVNAAGTLADAPQANEQLVSILPKSITGGILNEHGATQGTIRLRAHFLAQMEQMGEVADGRRAALENYATIYEGQVFVDGGKVEILKKSTALEVAPVTGNSPSGPASQRAASEGAALPATGTPGEGRPQP